MLSESGRYHIRVKIFSLMIKYLSHLLNTRSSILRAALSTSMDLSNGGFNSWFRNIVRILKFTNMKGMLQPNGPFYNWIAWEKIYRCFIEANGWGKINRLTLFGLGYWIPLFGLGGGQFWPPPYFPQKCSDWAEIFQIYVKQKFLKKQKFSFF